MQAMIGALKLLLGLMVFSTEARRLSYCDKKSREFKKCLIKGYTPKIFTSCEAKVSKESEMKGGKRRRCARVERRASSSCESFECKSGTKRTPPPKRPPDTDIVNPVPVYLVPVDPVPVDPVPVDPVPVDPVPVNPFPSSKF